MPSYISDLANVGATLPLLSLSLLVVCLLLAQRRGARTSGASLPPGPPASFAIGHLRLIPLHYPEKLFHRLSKTYGIWDCSNFILLIQRAYAGDIVHLYVPGRTMVVLNSVSAATELLEKRGLNNSCRPRFTMLVEIMGWDPTLTLMPYGKRSQKHRRLLQQYFSSKTLLAFQPYQERQARALALALARDSTNDYEQHVKQYVTAVIMKIAFGHQIQPHDEYIKMANDVSYTLDNSGAPGATPPDFIPILKHVPHWFPFASFSRFGHNWKWAVRKIHDFPLQMVHKQMDAGVAEPSFLSSTLENASQNDLNSAEDLHDIKGTAANIFCAGNDTTFASILVFILAMTLYPDVQRKAQEEIHKVLGRDRLPEFKDRGSLQYVECIVQETLRWHPVLPLGIPHKSLEDDVYQGYRIPSGSVIIANAFAMSMDEKVYADPEKFNPARFLPKPLGNSEPYFDAAWGFGRRVCVGRPLADATLWMAVATILATLRISLPTTINESETKAGPDFKFVSGGIISHPERFACSITPLLPSTEALVEQSLADSD